MQLVVELKQELAVLSAQLIEQTEARLAAVAANDARRERDLRARTIDPHMPDDDADDEFDDHLVRQLWVRAAPPTPRYS